MSKSNSVEYNRIYRRRKRESSLGTQRIILFGDKRSISRIRRTTRKLDRT